MAEGLTSWLVDASVLLAREDTHDQHHRDAKAVVDGPEAVTTLDLALYEAPNVAVRSWHDLNAAARLRQRVEEIARDGGLVRVDAALIERATEIAHEHGISVYDATYVAAARAMGAQLVSCDVRELVSRGLACLPGDAVSPT
ncbi:MAG: type II toxin-antitoxin system VapC family toxin [Acidimicrobiales bacterium]